jgi:predicted aspartyl protease
MITGAVNANREATIRLVVSGSSGQQQEIEAIIDTGFTGFLTLPPTLVQALGLAWLCRQPGILADGSIEVFDVYISTVIGMASLAPWRSKLPTPSRWWA